MVGLLDGETDGVEEGSLDGIPVGLMLGLLDGVIEGEEEGWLDGIPDGD
jgi:hypothetical protein